MKISVRYTAFDKITDVAENRAGPKKRGYMKRFKNILFVAEETADHVSTFRNGNC